MNESVCLLSWRHCYVWSAQKLYAWTLARSKSVKEVLTYLSLSQDFFLSFFFLPISRRKKGMYESLSLPSGVDSALRSCVTKREKWLEIRITVPLTINKLRIWYHVFVKQPGLRMTGTAVSRKQEWVMHLGQEIRWTQTLLCGKILWY